MPIFTVEKVRETLTKAISVYRPGVRAKFPFVADQKFLIKEVTHGSFRPNEAGVEFHDMAKSQNDFAMVARNGFNTARIQHTTPPPSLLDLAAEHDLRVIVGISAEQHVGHFRDGKGFSSAVSDVQLNVRACQRHPALLGYALRNEVPTGAAATDYFQGRTRHVI